MSHTTLARPTATSTAPRTAPSTTPDATPASARVPDNRSPYLAWGSAWLVGQGAFAVSSGPDPLVDLPALVPVVVLATGLVAALVVTVIGAARDQRGATGEAKRTGTLIAAGWGIGFTALFLLITAAAGQTGDQHLQPLLWPAGTGLVVGLVYLLGGTAQRDLHQYALGAWLALTSTAGLFLGLPGLYWVVALAGGGAYFAAAALEPRRRAAAAMSAP